MLLQNIHSQEARSLEEMIMPNCNNYEADEASLNSIMCYISNTIFN